MRTLHCLIVGFLLAITAPYATAELAFNNFHNRTSMLSVRSLAQDEGGMIWFGTERCLYSFDGYDLVPHPYPGGHIQINDLLHLPDRLLLGTNDGMYAYYPSDNRYERITPFREEIVRDLTLAEGFVYVGTDVGLYRFETGSDIAIRLLEDSVFSLFLSGDSLYVGLSNGLGVLQLSEGTYKPIPLKAQYYPVACILSEKDALWIGTPNQLIQVDPGNGLKLHTCTFPVVKSICRSGDGSLLVGTDNGLFKYDPETGIQQKVNPSVTWTSLQDRAEDLWFGTDDGLLHMQQAPIVQALTGLPPGSGIQYTALLNDSRDNFWVGGTGGLYRIGADGEVRHYAMSGSSYYIRHNKIRSIVEDQQTGEVYISSDGGLLRYEEHSGQMIPIRIAGTLNWIYDLLPIRNELWAATFEGVFRLKKDGTVLARYTQADGLSTDDIARIVRGRQGRVWALTRDQHLFSIDSDSGQVSSLSPEPEMPDCICGDQDGRIWAVSSNRISRITPQEHGADVRTISFHSNENIESYAMAEADGRIWICSSDGLFSVGKEDLEIRCFITERNYVGITSDDKRHSLLLGSAGAVDQIRIQDLQAYYESTPPALRVTGILVNGNRKLDIREQSGRPLQLPHNQNHLEISFSDFDYSEDLPHRFLYKLYGRRENGSGTVTGNKITLSALRPGRYHVAVGPAGIRSAPVDILYFRIRPPWYLSPLMVILYLCLLAGIIFTIIKLASTRRYLDLERQQRDKLIEQSRQKEAFFQDLAHELKTPLSLVIGPLGKLIRDARPGADLTDLQIAQENAMHLSSLIHHTIDYYKGTGGVADAPMTSDVEFVDFARTIFDSWRDNYPNHEFIFNSSHPAIPVNIDIVKIETVLNNLLSNACKYTPEGGSVLMTLERDDISHQLVIRVSDTGIGIPEDELPFAFQRYFESSRTKHGSYDSTGIGLSIIKDYVEVHGGQVSVDSDENGTTFTVLMPCLAEGAGVAEKSNPDNTDVNDPDKPLIAIVDDNAQICNFLESVLKPNYRCVSSHNGKSGLKLCQDVIPDLIISDVRMPVMDGLEMCRQIRQFGPLSTIPIILLTAKDDKQTEQESIDLNIDVFLPKPFEVPTLTARVGQLLGNQKRMEQRLRMEMLTAPGTARELSQDEKFMKKVTQLIENHLDDPDLSVTLLCKLGEFSEKMLYRKLKQFTGLSAVEYIRSIRLKKAALMLQSGKFTVSEVMYSVGFSNASYFTRIFSDVYNMTPSKYIKTFRNP